ncbi:hypothetical protein LEP1GSC060_0754 [Leptospira weilii serovar Ranarum str. ICFT]|uniref:Uncharacterized protein n=1 Tax=Leptospira weilii serovar Ranarum str. ICFT TaxID=1218598 RepID=N1WR78_9LEPT|nr:hypothetical protein LEP1GSC060_0754 [Leptospira weilii serovar Ranarum str. ICFT]
MLFGRPFNLLIRAESAVRPKLKRIILRSARQGRIRPASYAKLTLIKRIAFGFHADRMRPPD